MEEFTFFTSVLPMIFIRAGTAILCGALIGIERERRGKPAGFRTNTLICLGSTIYMLASELLLTRMGIANSDPTRIAAQVVTGIGFLGAGTIIQSRGTVSGLTSAATIWVVAGIGLLIGAGFPLIGVLCTLFVLMTLILLVKIEPKLLGKCQFVSSTITFSDSGAQTRSEIAAILLEHDIDFSKFDISKVDHNTSTFHLTYCDKHPSHHRFLSELLHIPGIIELSRNRS